MPFLPALLIAAALPSLDACVPARWQWPEPASLRLLESSPINCLLVEQKSLRADFVDAARDKGIAVFATVTSDSSLRLLDPVSGATLLELGSRAALRLNSAAKVVGTVQGLWPGVKAEEKGSTHARPSSAPWVVTNSGFLRFVRAASGYRPTIWIANSPPAGEAVSAARYVQAVADAAMTGARWVVTLDAADWQALRESQPRALAAWRRLNATLRFFEDQRSLSLLPDFSALAVVQDARTGALLSGSILDMIAAKHVPSTVVLPNAVTALSGQGIRTLLNLDPSLLDEDQRTAVRDVARQGATVLTGPPGWKMELPPAESITFAPEQLKLLDDIWREVNGLIGRRNFALRVFGAPSTLSVLKSTPDKSKLALFLVNYSDYPVEEISFHLLGKFGQAHLLTPVGERKLDVYEVDDGTGFDLPKLEDCAVVVFERQKE